MFRNWIEQRSRPVEEAIKEVKKQTQGRDINVARRGVLFGATSARIDVYRGYRVEKSYIITRGKGSHKGQADVTIR
jgi:hypothetical protein